MAKRNDTLRKTKYNHYNNVTIVILSHQVEKIVKIENSYMQCTCSVTVLEP